MAGGKTKMGSLVEVKGDELEGGVGGRMGRKCEGLSWWAGVRSKMGQ